MNLILQSLVPLAFVIFLGWLAGWRKIIDAKHSSSLATYVMSFSFPCLLFAKTATTSLQNLINYRFIAGLSLGLLGMYLVVFLFNRYLRRLSISHSCQTAFVSSFPDMAFMGIPIFLVLFGEESLISIVIGNLITSLIMIPVTVSILEIAQASEIKTNIMALLLKVFKEAISSCSDLRSYLFTFKSSHAATRDRVAEFNRRYHFGCVFVCPRPDHVTGQG